MASPPPCVVYSTLSLNTLTKRCRIDGRLYDVHLGKWMFYNPARQEKYFHVRSGKIDSTARSRPTDRQLSQLDETEFSGRYPISVWKEALATPISRDGSPKSGSPAGASTPPAWGQSRAR